MAGNSDYTKHRPLRIIGTTAGQESPSQSLFELAMTRICTLSFAIEPLEKGAPALSIVPLVNEVQLTLMVEEFEREHNYEPAGGYAGLVPSAFNFGPLDHYFMAETRSEAYDKVSHYLLGCNCGEVGCWPLMARITKGAQQILWNGFKQPFRPDRDYSSFGPFTFSVDQYRRTVIELAAAFPEA